MDPIRRIPPTGQTTSPPSRAWPIRPCAGRLLEEAAERRRREQRERARKQAARAWADAQLRAVQQMQDQGIVSEEDSDDGNPHVDIRV